MMKEMKRLIRDHRGVGPVISTVILVVLSLVLVVAVVLWLSDLVSAFTKFEKFETVMHALLFKNWYKRQTYN